MTQHQNASKSDSSKKSDLQKAPPSKQSAPEERQLVLDEHRPISSAEILHLQRTIGNRATTQLLQRRGIAVQRKKSQHPIQRTPAPAGDTEQEFPQQETTETPTNSDSYKISANAAPPPKNNLQRTQEDEDAAEYSEMPAGESAAPSHEISHRVDRTPETEEHDNSADHDEALMGMSNGDDTIHRMEDSDEDVQRETFNTGYKTYTGKDAEKAKSAYEDSKEEDSAGKKAGSFFAETSAGFLGPISIAYRFNSIKDDWKNADNVLAHGTGSWGKAVAGLKRTNIVLGEVNNALSLTQLVLLLLAPFTKGATLGALPPVSIASGVVSTIMAIFNAVMIIGQAVRISKLPEGSIERSLAVQSLVSEIGSFVGNTIGAVAGFMGAGGASSGAKTAAQSGTKTGLKGFAQGLGKGAAIAGKETLGDDNLSKGLFGAGIGSGVLGSGLGEINPGVSDENKKKMDEQIQTAPDNAGRDEQASQMETLAAAAADTTSLLDTSATQGNEQFQQADSKTSDAPADKLSGMLNFGETIKSLPGKLLQHLKELGTNPGKIKSFFSSLTGIGKKVNATPPTVAAAEPTGDDMKAVAQVENSANNIVGKVNPLKQAPLKKGGLFSNMSGLFGKKKMGFGGLARMVDLPDISRAMTDGTTIQRWGIFKKIGKAIKKAASAVGNAVKSAASKVADAAKAAWEKTKELAKKAAEKIKQWVMAVIEAIKKLIQMIIDKIFGFFKKMIAKIKEIINKVKEIAGIVRGQKQGAQQAKQLAAANKEKVAEQSSQLKTVATQVRANKKDDKDVA